MRPLQLVTLSGGLGNQMFQYAFLVHLRRRGARGFPYLGKIRHYGEHNGYELERVFGIALTPGERAMDGVLGLPLLGAAVKHIVFPFKYRERGESACAANAALAARGFLVKIEPHTASRVIGRESAFLPMWLTKCAGSTVSTKGVSMHRAAVWPNVSTARQIPCRSMCGAAITIRKTERRPTSAGPLRQIITMQLWRTLPLRREKRSQ